MKDDRTSSMVDAVSGILGSLILLPSTTEVDYMRTIRNLTPHEVTIIADNGVVVASFPSMGVARAKQNAETVGFIDGIELVSMRFGDPEDLPEYNEDVYNVVSIITANAAKASGRRVDDLLITCDPVRNKEGQIIGCRRFSIIE